jgi:NAD(P)-dependent dehydrogenase (short-subunit alcohol dehydrogenase family)
VRPGEERGDRGIAMWGAPASGKTTFLAALHVALIEQEPTWRLRGRDEVSTSSLVQFSALLAERGVFPVATGDVERYHWELIGLDRRSGWLPWRGKRRTEETRIQLDLVDAPGHSFAPEQSNHRSDLIDNLVNSSGILFLYDPVREFERGDAFESVFGVLAEMDAKAPPKGRLPHHVAVCVTKFDDPRVLATAEKLDMLEFGPGLPSLPRVADSKARDFFIEICNASRTRTARRILPLLEQTFHPERIRYFVTSSIGFYVDPETGAYDPDDPQNQVAEPEGARIRGPIHPINVVEPLLWLAKRIPNDT